MSTDAGRLLVDVLATLDAEDLEAIRRALALDTPDGGLLTAEEAAEVLAVGRRRVYSLARTGELPAVRVGERQIRFRRADLDRYLEGR